MESPRIHSSAEDSESIITSDIPIESLFDQVGNQRMWPSFLAEDAQYSDQILGRKRLIDALSRVRSATDDPTESLEDAVRGEKISEDEVADFYEALSNLLENSPEYRRIILYLPFEYLPDARWVPDALRLHREVDRMKSAYLRIWKKLLSVEDVRANFVDGDVLEIEQREDDLPRVVKSAHLIPVLVQKGWLSAEKVVELYNESSIQTLKDSIADTFGVLYDLGLIDEQFLRRHGISNEVSLRAAESKQEGLPEAIDPQDIEQDMKRQLSGFEVTEAGVTDKRRLWLEQVHKQRVTDEAAHQICISVEHDTFSDSAADYFLQPDGNPLGQSAFVVGVRMAIEKTAAKDIKEAVLLYEKFHERLKLLWEMQNSDVQPELEKLFFHLHHAGVVSQQRLEQLGLRVPKLGGPFSDNAVRMTEEIEEVQRMIGSIRQDPRLAECIYPVVLSYGSRLKGYGTSQADKDRAVFVREDVSLERQTEVRALLRELFNLDESEEDVTEFWLAEEGDSLTVRDLEGPDGILADMHLRPNVLFGSLWTGEEGAVRELYRKLLPEYFKDRTDPSYGVSSRSLYFEAFEIDLLQYRLMHKGYERYFPRQGGLQTAHSDRIDGGSVFWDSGYRATATKLFAEQIFLPKS